MEKTLIPAGLAPAPESTHWDRKDLLVALTLGLLAFLLYSIGRNPEFQGDDDYLYLRSFAMAHKALDLFSFAHISQFPSQVITLLKTVLSEARHAPLPLLLNGGFYHIVDILQGRFTMNLLHLPLALCSATTVALFYKILKSQGSPRLLALSGTLALLVSPLFLMVSRGQATYFLAFIPFSLAIALISLQKINTEKAPSWWHGLGLAQVIGFDVLWFITIPVLLGGFLLVAKHWKKALVRLGSPTVYLPVLSTAIFYIAGTLILASHGLSTPLFTLFTTHAKVAAWHPVISSPHYAFECLAILMGVSLPLWLMAAAITWIRYIRRRPLSLLTGFAICGILAYGTLFYGLTPEHNFVKNFYQIYLVVPVILMFVSFLTVLQGQQLRQRRWMIIILLGVLTTESLAAINYITKINTSPFASIFQDWAHGTNNPDHGTKAAGYVIRRWLNSIWEKSPQCPVYISTSHYNTSLAIFSGIGEGERGDYFTKQFAGPRPLKMAQHTNLLEDVKASLHRPLCAAIIISFSASQFHGQDLLALNHVHYFITLQNGEVVAVMVIPPPDSFPPPLPGGEYPLEVLEAMFDRDYHHFTDYFP